jgi:hypothetical protein
LKPPPFPAMFKKIKHGITVMMESMRKHEGPISLPEDFQSTSDQFKSIPPHFSSSFTILKAPPHFPQCSRNSSTARLS